MPASTLLVISKDKDFSSVVAEQVRRELGLTTIVAENNAVAKAALASAAIIVTSEGEMDKASCPVIAVDHPPLRLSQLLEDIAAHLPRQPDGVLPLGRGYSLYLRQKQLIHSGKKVDLTDKETQLLQTLAEAGNQGIAKDQLLKEVWGIEAVLDTHTLETHIYRLRGKCKELAVDELIEAVEGGYRLAP